MFNGILAVSYVVSAICVRPGNVGSKHVSVSAMSKRKNKAHNDGKTYMRAAAGLEPARPDRVVIARMVGLTRTQVPPALLGRLVL